MFNVHTAVVWKSYQNDCTETLDPFERDFSFAILYDFFFCSLFHSGIVHSINEFPSNEKSPISSSFQPLIALYMPLGFCHSIDCKKKCFRIVLLLHFSGDFIIEFSDTNDFIFIFVSVAIFSTILNWPPFSIHSSMIVNRILTLFFCCFFFIFQLVLHRMERKM